MSPNFPPNILPKAPQNIRTIKTLVANSIVNSASVNSGTKWTIGTDMQMQQNITAEQSQVMASFSDKGKSLGSSSTEVLACSRQGDSLMNSAAGMAINR